MERSQTLNYNTGVSEVDAEENNITVVSTHRNDTIYGDGRSSSAYGWGVVFQFNPNFTHDAIMDFYSHSVAADATHLADAIQLPKTEPADSPTFFNATSDGSGGTLSTAANGFRSRCTA